MSIAVEFVATSNEWDAPIAFYVGADDNAHCRRDADDPGFEWTHRTFYPHGVVMVDGVMSRFDAARQPGAPQ